MLELQGFALHHDCRLILTGDTKQHHSVQWGDALRILECSGAVAQTELTKIHRQQIPQIREAIEDLSKGRTAEGFDKLDKFGPSKKYRKTPVGWQRLPRSKLRPHRPRDLLWS